MANKFKFRLQPVLKLKEIREQEIKNSLGRIVKEIESKNIRLNELKDDIQFYFDKYENAEINKEKMLAGLRSYMPEFLTSHYEKIKNITQEIISLDFEKNKLINSLAMAKSQTKIFSNLKEKKFNEYKVQLNKKMEQEIEELAIIKRGHDEINKN